MVLWEQRSGSKVWQEWRSGYRSRDRGKRYYATRDRFQSAGAETGVWEPSPGKWTLTGTEVGSTESGLWVEGAQAPAP